MINTSRVTPIFLDSPDSLERIEDAKSELLQLLEESRGRIPHDWSLSSNLQLRGWYAFHYVATMKVSWGKLRPQLFTLATFDKNDMQAAREAYLHLCGHYPVRDEDITGLKTPLKAFFLLLWKKKQVLLPVEFSRKGVDHMLPALYSKTDGFFTEIAINSQNIALKTLFRDTQFCVNWHEPTDVSFIDIWNSLPELLKSRREDGAARKNRMMLTPWLGEFARHYPDILSMTQYNTLCKYHDSLSKSQDIDNNVETPESFLVYVNLTESDRVKYRRDIKLQALDLKKVTDFESQLKNGSPEEIFASLKNGRRPQGFEWCTCDYYNIDPKVYGELMYEWVILFSSYLHVLSRNKLSKSVRLEQIAAIRLFLDYLFAYLPAWVKCNPKSFIKTIPSIHELDRFIHFVQLDYQDENDDDAETQPVEFTPPKTYYQVLPLRRSSKTLGIMIRRLHMFFEHCKSNARFLYKKHHIKIADDFENPINIDLDVPGSGGRGTTNKIVLPMASIPLARRYMELLNDVGMELRTKILSGNIASSKDLYQSDWIDLKAFGLERKIEVSPNNKETTQGILIEKIPNCFHWKYDTYNTGEFEIKITLPWLSTLRMLMVGLFAGQRIQGAQWLDINNFDKNYNSISNSSSYWVSLFLNTDKTQPLRFICIQRNVMKYLIDEKYFQKNICGSHLDQVFYENDQHSKYKKITPLFRSPFNGKGLPFADSTYSVTWIKVLKGIQYEYNKIVPKEDNHAFVISNDKGEKAVHTPHALRATWITYMRRYGGLEISIIQKQVGHSNALTTNYYMALPADIQEADLEQADRKFMEQTFSHLATFRSLSVKPSAPNSSLQTAFNQNRTAAKSVHQMTSKSSSFIDTNDKTGLDLIDVLNIGDFSFFDDCTCPFGGNCPRAVMNFTKMARCCGICPYAIFSLDNLPAIQAKIRHLFKKIKSLTASLDLMIKANEPPVHLDEMRDDLAMMSLNMSGYYQTSELLQDLLASYSTRNTFHVRAPDILKAKLIGKVPLDSPGMNIVTDVIDGAQYPSICGDHYLESVRQLSRRLHQHLDTEGPEGLSQVDGISAQLLSIMRAYRWDIEKVVTIITEGKALALENVDAKAKNQPR